MWRVIWEKCLKGRQMIVWVRRCCNNSKNVLRGKPKKKIRNFPHFCSALKKKAYLCSVSFPSPVGSQRPWSFLSFSSCCKRSDGTFLRPWCAEAEKRWCIQRWGGSWPADEHTWPSPSYTFTGAELQSCRTPLNGFEIRNTRPRWHAYRTTHLPKKMHTMHSRPYILQPSHVKYIHIHNYRRTCT